MKVLVCGSRHFQDYELLKRTLDAYTITSIVEGEARGADLLGRRYGEENGLPVYRFPADWNQYGRRAGPIRNAQMVREGRPDMVIAFLAPNSRGTQNMIDQATKAEIPVRIIDIG
jgi:hypothetical protein